MYLPRLLLLLFVSLPVLVIFSCSCSFFPSLSYYWRLMYPPSAVPFLPVLVILFLALVLFFSLPPVIISDCCSIDPPPPCNLTCTVALKSQKSVHGASPISL